MQWRTLDASLQLSVHSWHSANALRHSKTHFFKFVLAKTYKTGIFCSTTGQNITEFELDLPFVMIYRFPEA